MNAADLLDAVVVEVEPDGRGHPESLVLRLPDGRLVVIDGHPEHGIAASEREA
jgi:hypothetical protein